MMKDQEKTDVVCTEVSLFPSFVQSSTCGGLVAKTYGVRYWIIRSLTSYVPFLPQWVTGGKSVLELLLMKLALMVFIIVIQGYDGSTSGEMVDKFAGLMIVFGLRNNVLTLLFGISFERALEWHQFVARLVIILAIIHATINFQEFGLVVRITSHKASGIALIVTFILTSLSILVKSYWFEAFYYFHISMFFLAVIIAAIHNANVFAFSALIWAFDIFVRYYLTAHKVEADVTALPGDIVRISFKKPFDYTPTQYCFVSIPSLSHFQFHPFSISSAPHESEVSFNMKVQGDWTRSVRDLTLKNSSGNSLVEDSESDSKDGKKTESQSRSMKLIVNIEGPYGMPMIDLASGYYRTYLFIAGGIGITPIQSIYNHLVHKHNLDPSFLRKCILIWTVKDQALISSFEDIRAQLPTDAAGSSNPNLNHYNSQVYLEEGNTNPMIEMKLSKETVPMDLGSTKLATNKNGDDKNSNVLNPYQGAYPFVNEFYLTSSSTANSKDYNNTHNLHSGRPNISNIIELTGKMCSRENIGRVAVVTCGPPAMVQEVSAVCAKRHSGVAFDVHKEVFNL